MAAKLTPLAIAVLELLHERPMHPYEMAQLMRERYVTKRVKVKAGSLYHTVDRLVQNGFVDIVETQRDGKRPERTVYAMTEAGRDEFVDRAKGMLSTPADEYPEYLSGLGAIDELGRETSVAQLKHRVLQLQAAAAADQVVLDSLVNEQHLPEVYWLDWSYTTAHRAFELEWTQKLIEDLESGRIQFQDHCLPNLNLVTEDASDERKTS
ncbi:PadR family transcriptional regulator [Amycolatopsis orientalis]|uniref:PadR family transcriptional regulator n=1 Tax=Amycolatopsis orientalis TaxID=31958 RepID=A0A193C7Z4_AMYOR|nr:PadR family transcriptional regulator [Amycolatopsis orientalis]ANN20564.1 PadR family transcriptional regulator [Amycolatopsis orientalis]